MPDRARMRLEKIGGMIAAKFHRVAALDQARALDDETLQLD